MSSIYGASRSHSDTPHSVRLLWMSDQLTQRPLPDKTQHSQARNIRNSARTETTRVASKAAAELHFRPRGHCDGVHKYIM